MALNREYAIKADYLPPLTFHASGCSSSQEMNSIELTVTHDGYGRGFAHYNDKLGKLPAFQVVRLFNVESALIDEYQSAEPGGNPLRYRAEASSLEIARSYFKQLTSVCLRMAITAKAAASEMPEKVFARLSDINYANDADLYIGPDMEKLSLNRDVIHFRNLSEAIRHAMEELTSSQRYGCFIRTGVTRLNQDDISYAYSYLSRLPGT